MVDTSSTLETQVSETLPTASVSVEAALEKFLSAVEADVKAGGGVLTEASKITADALADLIPIVGQAAAVVEDGKTDPVGVAQVIANGLANRARVAQGKLPA